ncbi:MAG TPA: galactosyltransferase-related protein, partial [Cytophagaceae bacterium]|nr:galactosyltransferase-related protein [Cytophagaceae bacterium]
VSFSKKEFLFFCDADILLNRECFDLFNDSCLNNHAFYIENVIEKEHVFEKSKFKKSRNYEMKFELNDGRIIIIPLNKVNYDQNSVRGCGLIFVNKLHFISINGFNSNLTTWGWEDIDFMTRLMLKENIMIKGIGTAIHLTHSNINRNLKGLSKTESEENNFQKCLNNYHMGNYDGTYITDIINIEDITNTIRLI